MPAVNYWLIRGKRRFLRLGHKVDRSGWSFHDYKMSRPSTYQAQEIFSHHDYIRHPRLQTSGPDVGWNHDHCPDQTHGPTAANMICNSEMVGPMSRGAVFSSSGPLVHRLKVARMKRRWKPLSHWSTAPSCLLCWAPWSMRFSSKEDLIGWCFFYFLIASR